MFKSLFARYTYILTDYLHATIIDDTAAVCGAVGVRRCGGQG